MIPALTLLLVCQLAGEALARLFGWPLPGPVLGLVLLFAGLHLRDRFSATAPVDPSAIETTPLGLVAGVILANLSLLFVPAGVGIVRHAGTLAAHGAGLILALFVSTALTLVVTALVFRLVARAMEKDDPSSAPDVGSIPS